MKLIVGLGNPGIKYEKTRHNIGFTYINQWAESRVLGNWKFESKYKAELITTEIDGEKLVLCKPQTYMNLSGEAVSPLAKFYKISGKDILVIHDEIDFETGRVALKFGGSPAGHNGLKSIIEKLGTRDFWRLRIGIDRSATKDGIVDWVLSSFKPTEKEILIEKKDKIFNLIDEFLIKKD